MKQRVKGNKLLESFLKSVKYFSVILVLLGFTTTFSVGQLTVDTSPTAQQFVQQLIGSGVAVSNVTYSGATGTGVGGHVKNTGGYDFNVNVYQIGNFSDGNTTNIGLDGGLILSSGNVKDAELADQTSTGQFPSGYPANANSTDNDVDLSDLTNNNSYNCSILEFDFVPQGDHISFDYVFASSEYPGWVDSPYNDVFGFFLSGPGISGSFSNNSVNIAVLPSTSTPVSINNVNGGSGSNGGCPSGSGMNSQYYVDNCTGTTIPYHGFTTVLTAEYDVVCGETYHIKLAISDIDDVNWDSAIFLKRNSLVSPGGEGGSIDLATDSGEKDSVTICKGESVVLEATVSGISGGDYEWEPNGETTPSITVSPTSSSTYIAKYKYTSTGTGCTGGTTITITDTINVVVSPVPDISVNQIDPSCGNSDGSIDITLNNSIPSPVTYAIGNSIPDQTDDGLFTGLNAGNYSILVTNDNDCEASETINLSNTGGPTIDNVSSTDASCNTADGTITVTASGGTAPFSYELDNSETSNNGTFTGVESGNYTVTVTDDNDCETSENVTVDLGNGPTIDDLNTTDPGCSNDDGEIEVIASGGADPLTYEWFDENNQSIGTSSNIDGLGTGDYSVEVTDASGCKASENATLDSPSVDDPSFTISDFCSGGANSADNIITPGGTFSLIAPIDDGATIDASNGAISNGVEGTTYTIEYKTSGGCPNTSSEEVTVLPSPNVTFNATPVSGQSPLTVEFENTSSNTSSFIWDFGIGEPILDDNVIITNIYEDAGDYKVILTGKNTDGCTDTATIHIVVESTQMEYAFPNIFTPNEDGQNDMFKLINATGIQDLEIIILNRWGNLVFEGNKVDFKWNGKVKNEGANCDDGTYFYKATLNGLDSTIKIEHGFVQLSRSK